MTHVAVLLILIRLVDVDGKVVLAIEHRGDLVRKRLGDALVEIVSLALGTSPNGPLLTNDVLTERDHTDSTHIAQHRGVVTIDRTAGGIVNTILVEVLRIVKTSVPAARTSFLVGRSPGHTTVVAGDLRVRTLDRFLTDNLTR